MPEPATGPEPQATAESNVPPPSQPGDDARMGLDGRWLLAAAGAVAPHPTLWATAVTQLLRLATPGWWRRWPPVPLPPAGYLRFRLQTYYGGEGRPPAPADVVAYLRWCRDWPGDGNG